MSEPCPVCKKPFHKRRKRFIETGSFGKQGRPRKVNYQDIRDLRKNEPELSYRELAHRNKATIGMVVRALKELTHE